VLALRVDGVFGCVYAESVPPAANQERGRDQHGPTDDCLACMRYSCPAAAHHSHCHRHTVRICQ